MHKEEEEYRRCAVECFTLASFAVDDQFRDSMIELARAWLEIAREAKNLRVARSRNSFA